MHPRVLIPLLAAALVSLTGCDIEDIADGSRYDRDFHYTYPMKSGAALEVETFNGSIEISSWEQPAVDISGTKYGSRQASVDALRIDIDHSSDHVAVRAVRSSSPVHNGGARLVIKAPRNAVLERIRTSNGPIRITDCAGPARLTTSNGPIRVRSFSGPLTAETSNGPVEIAFENGLTGALHVNTSNGPITIEAPTEPNARVVARTSNGSITSDFDIRVSGQIGKNHMDGTLGNGGTLIELETSNGPIRILKR